MRPLTSSLIGLLLFAAPSAAQACPLVEPSSTASGFVGMAASGPYDTAVFVRSWSEFATLFGATSAGLGNPHLAPSVAAYFENGGQRLYVVRVASTDDASVIGAPASAGVGALDVIDEIGVVAAPGFTSLAVQSALVQRCAALGDRMALLDPVATDDVGAVLAQGATLSGSDGYAALYYPWVVASPLGTTTEVPPSAYAAAAFANTSPHESPVGVVTGALGVTDALTTTEQDDLTFANINPLMNFGGSVVRIWGARTLSSDPEWKYVAVRRIANAIEEAIAKGTDFAVFEPNDANLWAQLEECVGDFMHSLWMAGWIQGTTPEEAYFVRVDATTMTAADLEDGRTVGIVGFAPLRPAEFLLLDFAIERDASAVSSPRVHVTLLPARPNPFNPTTTIAFDMPRAGRARLRLFDVAGRQVRSLVDADVASGRHQINWNGRDDRGVALASGVYFAALEVAGERRRIKLSLIE